MAIETRLVWNGDREIRQMDDAVYRALIRATNKVQSDAKLLVPVDTGNLRGSIVKTVDRSDQMGTVLTNSEYAFYVEFGLRSNPNYPIQPYMRPALNDNKDNIERMFIEEGRRAVDN